MSPFIMGMVGGVFSSILMIGSFSLLTPQLSKRPLEIVTVDATVLKQTFASALVRQHLSPEQEEQKMRLFWEKIQEGINKLSPKNKVIVLMREASLNRDLRDVTEELRHRLQRDIFPETPVLQPSN